MTATNDAVNADGVSAYVHWNQIAVEYNDDGPAYLIITIPELDAALWPRIRIPDKIERNPVEWWFIEVFTGVAADRVADAWEKNAKRNKLAEDVKGQLAAALSGQDVPLTRGGVPDLDRFRGEVIRARLQKSGLDTPFLIPLRPDLDVQRARSLLRDVYVTSMYRYDVEPGVSRGVPAIVAKHEGRASLSVLGSEVGMRGIVNRSIRVLSGTRGGGTRQPPQELVQDLIYFPDAALPVLNGITRIPSLREDGTILDKVGYDSKSRLFYAPDIELEPIPDVPTDEDVADERELILLPFAEFPFVGEQDRTALLACLLEQIVRTMIRGPRPLYVFDAPIGGQGVGKTLAAKTCRAIITGEADSTITSIGRREEEVEKRITSILRSGNNFVVLDNLVGTVGSESLMQLATSERFQARLLGVSESPSLRQLSTWCLTLNGARLVRDIARRSVLIRLDAKVERAWERSGFEIENLITWVLERRAAIIRALLVLARSWVCAGQPRDPDVVRGSFESWSRVVGGVLRHARFYGLADALRAADERDPDAEDHRHLILAWMMEHSGQALTALGIGELAQRNGLYAERITRFAKGIALAKRASTIVQSILGRPIAGHRIELHDTMLNHCRTYRLTPHTD